MVENFGISHGGLDTEELFRQATGAQIAPRAALGDAVLDGHFVEVKAATSNTLNQVRAVKYIPLAAYHRTLGIWFVVPAHVIVRQVSEKTRGQHTENPFESATLSLAKLASFRVEELSELRGRTLAAVAESDGYPRLRDAMHEILAESARLAKTSIDTVRQVMAEYKLT